MTRRIRRQRGLSLVEAVVALLILSLMLLGVSRLVIEQSRLVNLSRVDSQMWQIADSILEQRRLVQPLPSGGECATHESRCELALDPMRYSDSWPVSTSCPDCRLELILEAPSGLALTAAPFIRESVSVEWSVRGRRRSLRHGRIRS